MRHQRAKKLTNREASSFLGAALIAFALLALWAGPAFAIETHAFTGITIGPGGNSAAGQFTELASVALDPSNGDLYVLDTADGGRLYKFASNGEPLDFTATGTNFIEGTGGFPRPTIENQVAVAPPGAAGGTAGDIYIANSQTLTIYSEAGLEIGQIAGPGEGTGHDEPCGVAVDAEGNIFTKSDFAGIRGVIRKYTPTTNPPTEIGHSAFPINETCNLAVDSKGRIYAAGSSQNPWAPDGSGLLLWKLQSLSAEEKELFDPHASAVSVEPVTDDVYASHGIEVVQYSEGGSVISRFGEHRLVQAPGVSVAGAGGDVYVSSRTVGERDGRSVYPGRVDVFGPLVTLPKALAETPEHITKTSALLRGTINADGGPQATCKFEYTTQAAFQRSNEMQQLAVSAGGGTFTLSFVNPAGGATHATAPIAFNASAATVRAALEALPNIGSENVTVAGGPGNKTGAAPYTITFVGPLGGENLEQLSVDPAGLTETEGPGAAVQTVADGHAGGFAGASSAPCSPGGPFTGNASETVTTEVSGLAPGGEYRFRLVGENENGSLGSDENGSAPGATASFETLPAFNVHTGSVEALGTNSATLTGSINPEGVGVSECFFEYGVTVAYGHKVSCEIPGGGEVGNGNAPVPVHASAPGLAGSTVYHYRLVGSSSESGGIRVEGGDAEFGTQGPPEILSEAFSGIGRTNVTISGSINPHSLPTTYFVEYIVASAYEANVKAGHDPFTAASKVPIEGVAIGSGFTGVEVQQALSGLSPGTTYHFRLYAENGNALSPTKGADKAFTTHVDNQPFAPCPANEVFRVGPGAALPDCRAYEQVSSPDKNGDSVAGLYPTMFASEDGSAVTFYSPAGTPPPADRGGTQNYSTYLARRDTTAGSWSSQRLLPPEELGEFAEFLGSTPDLRFAVVEAGVRSKYAALFVIDTEDGQPTRITPDEQTGLGINHFGFDGASGDGSRIFFESDLAINTRPGLPTPALGHDNLYMWERSTGVSLVGVLPTNEAPSAGSFGGAYEWYETSLTSTGGALNKVSNSVEPLGVASLHAISPSGDQIFFTAAGTGQLYLRRGLDGANPTTLRISTPNPGVTPAGEFPAAFLEATPDGSRAFFMSREQLTADGTSGEGEGDSDLYRWDKAAPEGRALTDIAPNAEVQGLLGVNAAGTAGYFIARRALAGSAESGRENLYRFEEKKSAGGGFRVTFIATLAEGIEQSVDRRNVSPKVGFGFAVGKTSRVSDSGETLLFSSIEPLTNYDNFNLEGASCEGGHCPELYRYSVQSGKSTLTCISCDPTGELPLGAASLQDQFFNAYFTPTEPPAINVSRNLSADGTKVFFQTPDPLVAGDENGILSCPAFGGKPGQHNLAGPRRCQDVYEWEAVGSGSCKAVEADGGCLYLLSTGQSGQPSYFVGASRDGSSAFIATTSQLVPVDRDQAADVYDVREDGGLASQQARPPVPCSSAEACKGAASASPPPTSPTTPSFQGPGNPKPKRCKKGYVAKKGKCVKKAKKAQKKKKARKHHHKSKRASGKRRSGGAK